MYIRKAPRRKCSRGLGTYKRTGGVRKQVKGCVRGSKLKYQATVDNLASWTTNVNHTSSNTSTELGYNLVKHKLWKGYSYPLKRSILDEHLRLLDVSSIKDVWYLGPAKERFGPAGEIMSAGTYQLFFYVVPSETRKLCELLLVRYALPLICRGLQAHDLQNTGFVLDGDRLLAAVQLPQRNRREAIRYDFTELGSIRPDEIR